MGLKVITPAVALPITLDDAKTHLGVTANDRDLFIECLIRSVVTYLERWVGRTFINTTYELTLFEFPRGGCPIELPHPPLSSVTSLEYRDADGALQTIDPADYQIEDPDNVAARLWPSPDAEWPGTQFGRVDAVKVTYIAGYGALAVNVPDEAKHAIRLMLRHWYDNGSAVVAGTISKEMELSARSLIRSMWTGSYANLSLDTPSNY